jgi:lysophospholipase L1-like esterase
MKICFYGDSLTDGFPGVSYFKLLQSRLPGHTLINCGRFNDTAIALYRRIITQRLLVPVDVSFVWAGVNDVLVRRSPLSAWLRRWWARDNTEFRIHYRALLDLLTPFAGALFAASPALIGEDADSAANAALAELSAIIGELAAGYANVTFLDVHADYMAALRDYPPVHYRSKNRLQSVVDALKLRTPAAVDRTAAARGLRLTLDGVHLNSAGAQIAADTFERAIRRCEPACAPAPAPAEQTR